MKLLIMCGNGRCKLALKALYVVMESISMNLVLSIFFQVSLTKHLPYSTSRVL